MKKFNDMINLNEVDNFLIQQLKNYTEAKKFKYNNIKGEYSPQQLQRSWKKLRDNKIVIDSTCQVKFQLADDQKSSVKSSVEKSSVVIDDQKSSVEKSSVEKSSVVIDDQKSSVEKSSVADDQKSSVEKSSVVIDDQKSSVKTFNDYFTSEQIEFLNGILLFKNITKDSELTPTDDFSDLDCITTRNDLIEHSLGNATITYKIHKE
jgi:hypothetical protein